MNSAGASECNIALPEDGQQTLSLMSLANQHLSKYCSGNEEQSSLMSLASQHLSKYNLNNDGDSTDSNMTFFIPKLRTEDNDDGNIPDISGLIIKCHTAAANNSDDLNSEIAKENVANRRTVIEDKASTHDDYVIDLTVALIKTNLNEPVVSIPIIEPPLPEKLIFNPPAMLIKEVKSAKTCSLPCLFTTGVIPRKKPSKKGSPMSRVICAKYKEREVLKIVHKYHETYRNLKPFKFDTLSPDEIVLRNLKLKKPAPSWVEVFNKL